MKNDRTYLIFDFHLNSKFELISEGLRMSIWQENHSDYLMPGEFVQVEMIGSNYYKVKLAVLDPDGFLNNAPINKKFFFGHTGRVFGYGELKEILR